MTGGVMGSFCMPVEHKMTHHVTSEGWVIKGTEAPHKAHISICELI